MRANLNTDGRQDARAAGTYAADAEGIGDSRAEASGRAGRAQKAHPARPQALVPGRFGEQGVEHRCVGVAPVVPPDVLVDVALEPLLRDGVVGAADAVLEQAEKPFDGLRVYVAVNV